MTRIALRIAYNGSRYQGWQTQPHATAIQDLLEGALAAVADGPVASVCAGRTDTGVHASAQVVHFDTEAVRPMTAWTRGVNANLPDDIAVLDAMQVDPKFHARFDARRRRYHYFLYRAANRHPLRAGRAAWVHQSLDVAAMAAACPQLVGRHDFSAFRSSQCQARSPVRDMQQLALVEQGDMLRFELVANAFLHHMVRNIVGALVWVGMGRRPPDWIGELLASGRRSDGAATFSPEGLYLTGVDYQQDGLPDSWGAGCLSGLPS